MQRQGKDKKIEVLILFNSFTFSGAEMHYGTYKRELKALVTFAQKYYYILLNREVSTI